MVKDSQIKSQQALKIRQMQKQLIKTLDFRFLHRINIFALSKYQDLKIG